MEDIHFGLLTGPPHFHPVPQYQNPGNGTVCKGFHQIGMYGHIQLYGMRTKLVNLPTATIFAARAHAHGRLYIAQLIMVQLPVIYK